MLELHLQVRKWEHREVSHVSKATQPVWSQVSLNSPKQVHALRLCWAWVPRPKSEGEGSGRKKKPVKKRDEGEGREHIWAREHC